MTLALVLAGCGLDRTPLFAAPALRDAGASDAGPRDGGPSDGATDGGVPFDAGPPCVEGCEGEWARTCDAGPVDCAATGAFCVLDESRARCRPRVCEPSTTRCSSDGARVETCDARGSAVVASTTCPRGCVGAACRAETPCSLPIARTMSEGTASFDLCGGGNDARAADFSLSGCSALGFAMSGEDRVVRLEVDRPGRYRLELSSPSLTVDPVLSVQARCADSSSLLGCDNNGGGGLSARLELDLPAGDHFVVLDTFDYTVPGGFAFGCGSVTLTITRLSP